MKIEEITASHSQQPARTMHARQMRMRDAVGLPPPLLLLLHAERQLVIIAGRKSKQSRPWQPE